MAFSLLLVISLLEFLQVPEFFLNINQLSFFQHWIPQQFCIVYLDSVGVTKNNLKNIEQSLT